MQHGKGYLTGGQAIRDASDSAKKYYLPHDCGQPLLHKQTPLLPSRHTEETNTNRQGNQISKTTLKVSCHFLLILSSLVLNHDVILSCGLS